MGLAGQDSISDSNPGHDMVLGEALPGGKAKQRRRLALPDLKIAENIFGNETVIALVDAWIVPAIVNKVIRDIMKSAEEGR